MVKLLQINFVQYSLPNGISDLQFSTDLDFHLIFLFQYWQPRLRDFL